MGYLSGRGRTLPFEVLTKVVSEFDDEESTWVQVRGDKVIVELGTGVLEGVLRD